MEHPSDLEKARLAQVHATGLGDRDLRLALRSHVAMAKLICQTTLASVSLIESDRVSFLSHNFPKALDVSELPRGDSLCQHVLPSGATQIVADLRKDPRFSDNIYVNGPPRFVFWAGFPLIDDQGFTLGSLSVAEFHPITLDTRTIELMEGLARQVTRHLKSLTETLPDIRPRLAGLLHRLTDIAPDLRLDHAEAFVRLCIGTAPEPQQAQALLAADLVRLGPQGDVTLSPLGQQIRAEHHLDSPQLPRKGARLLHQDQVAFYLAQLAASGSAA